MSTEYLLALLALTEITYDLTFAQYGAAVLGSNPREEAQ